MTLCRIMSRFVNLPPARRACAEGFWFKRHYATSDMVCDIALFGMFYAAMFAAMRHDAALGIHANFSRLGSWSPADRPADHVARIPH